MPPEPTSPTSVVLVVVQIIADADPEPALGALATIETSPALRRVLVRPPSLAELPVPAGVELVIESGCDRALLATRLRSDPTELVVVLTDDEQVSPTLATSLAAAARDASPCAYDAERRVRFLGRALPSDPVTIAWRGDVLRAPAPTRLTGTLEAVAASVTATIDRLEALAKRPGPTAPVGPADFVGRPLTAVIRRLWRRRRCGVPGVVLSIVETYGEVLAAAQAWERHGIAARRAERQSGVPRGFHIWRTPMGSLTLRDGTPPMLREALLDATPAVVAGMPLAGGRGAVWAVTLADHERGVLRWYRRGGFVRHLIFDRYFGWTPRPIRELALTEEAIRRGVAAPEVLAARVDRLPWGWYRGAIVTREVTGARTFADELRHHPTGADRTRIIAAVGRAIRDLHDRGVHHRDLNANNILVSPADGGEAVHFIDFDRAVVHAALGRGIRGRELRRLERSLVKLAGAGMPLHPDDTQTLRAAYTSTPGAAMTGPLGSLPLATRLVLLVIAVVLLVSAIRNIKEDGDFRGYIEVGELVLQGADIYADSRPDVNTWPPLYSIVCVPFALLARVSVYLARAVWLALNFVCIAALLRLAVLLVYDKPLVLHPRAGAIALASGAVVGPLVLSARFLLGNLDRLQINMVILAACLVGVVWVTRGRPVAGGAIIGFAAAVKVLPIFFLPYFAWKRWWTALGAALVTGGLASLAPILVFGWERFLAYADYWIALSSGSWPVRKGNQSVYAMVDRLYTHDAIVWHETHKRLTASNDPVVAAIVYGLLAVVAVAFVWASRRGGERPTSAAVTVEVAIILCVTVLFAPLAWKHYFVFLLLGQVVLWRAAFGDGYGLPAAARRRVIWMLGLSYVLTTLTVRGVVGKPLAQTLETMSAVTFGALVVLAALLYVRHGLGARAPADAAS